MKSLQHIFIAILFACRIANIFCRADPVSSSNIIIENDHSFQNPEEEPSQLNVLSDKTRDSSQSWPDERTFGNVNKTVAYDYEDFHSQVVSFLMDEDAMETQESKSHSSQIKISKVTSASKIKCNSTDVNKKVKQAGDAIATAVNLLKKAQTTPNAIKNTRQLVKSMQKWLGDVGDLLRARDFKKAAKKLNSVTNNIEYSMKNSDSPSSKHIANAIPQSQVVDKITDYLSKCVFETAKPSIPQSNGPKLTLPDCKSYSSMEAIRNSKNAVMEKNSLQFRLDKTTDIVSARSQDTFTNGVFSIDFKCPPDARDSITTFFLSSTDDMKKRQGIFFNFLGYQKTRARLGTIVNGSFRGTSMDFGWDCSDAVHTYTIIRDPDTISWIVDNETLRTITRNDPNSASQWVNVESTRLYLTLERDYTEGKGSNLRVGFENLKVCDPITTKSRPQVPFWPKTNFPMSKFGVDYCHEEITRVDSEVVIPFGIGKHCWGGRIISPKRYNFGTFSSQIKCPTGNPSGLITSFYLSSFEGGSRFKIMDEIDFEFLGKNNSIFQATVFVNGKAVKAKQFPLRFDCSKAFHTYTIEWTFEKIRWFVDDKMKYEYVNDGVNPYPVKPSYLYASVWKLSGDWAGIYKGLENDKPYFARYKNMRISPLAG